MRQVIAASVRLYARRYVAAAAAVIVAVAFIVVANALSSATRNGMLADLAAQYVGVEAVVSDVQEAEEADQVLEEAAARDTAATVNALGFTDVLADGRLLAQEVPVGTQSTLKQLRWQELVDGSFAARPGQVVVDEHQAEVLGVGVGDSLVLRAGTEKREVEVTGLAEAVSGPLSAAVYATWPDLTSLGTSMYVQNVVMAAPPSGTTASVSMGNALPERLLLQDRTEYLTERQAEITRGADMVAVMLLLFAAVALFVSVLVISNTFTILLAQRARDFALLRCVGATRRQVMGSVRAEALAIGLLASLVGLVVGVAAGHGLVALALALIPAAALGEVEISPLWLGGAWVVGVLMTLLASVVPARKSTRISPLAALRPEPDVAVRTRAGAIRVTIALGLVVAGAAALAVAVDRSSLVLMLGAGFVNFVGVLLLLGPVLVPALLRVVGPLVSRGLGVPGRIASLNARRNARRTAASAASLLVGVTLVTGVVVGMSTVRTVVGEELDAEYPLDATLTATAPMDAGALDQVRDIEGVDEAATVPGALATISARGRQPVELALLAPGAQALATAHGTPEFSAPAHDEVYLPWGTISDYDLPVDGSVTVTVGGEERRLTLRGAEGFGTAAVVAAPTLEELSRDAAGALAIWARAGAGADPADVHGSLQAVGRIHDAEIDGGLPNRDWVELQLDVVTGSALALLAIAVLIALVGIASSLGLSVLERTREHALLRALGLSRRQMRGTLAIEAVLLAGLAAVLGIALGSVYAWVAVRTAVSDLITDVQVDLPVGQLALVVLAALAVGLVACLLPARRAARIEPVVGLAAE